MADNEQSVERSASILIAVSTGRKPVQPTRLVLTPPAHVVGEARDHVRCLHREEFQTRALRLECGDEPLISALAALNGQPVLRQAANRKQFDSQF